MSRNTVPIKSMVPLRRVGDAFATGGTARRKFGTGRTKMGGTTHKSASRRPHFAAARDPLEPVVMRGIIDLNLLRLNRFEGPQRSSFLHSTIFCQFRQFTPSACAYFCVLHSFLC